MRHSHCKPSRAEQNRTAWVVRSFTDSVRHFYDYNEVTGRPLYSSCDLFDIWAEIYKNKYSKNILTLITKNGNVFHAGLFSTMKSVKYLPHIHVFRIYIKENSFSFV
jgi:hypothetical protein